MQKGQEQNFSERVMNVFRTLHKNRKIIFGEKVKIASDFTFLPNDLKFGLGFTETDIAFYRTIPFEKKNSEIIRSFKFIRDAADDDKCLNIPLVILELKSGDLGSDAIRSRAMVARLIKQIFPDTSYFFVAEGTKKTDETLIRQGKDFDSYFLSDETFGNSEIKDIYRNFIKPKLRKSLYK